MFYDSQIMNSDSLNKAWRAGNSQELGSEEVPLPKVCSILDSWVGSDYQDPCRRLSLRTSSILVNGVAKLHKQGLDDLLQDVYKLDYQMITRKRPSDTSSNDDPNFISNSSEFQLSYNGAPGHSTSAVKSDSSDTYKRGKIGKRGVNMTNPHRIRKRVNERVSATTSNNAELEDLPIGHIIVYEKPGDMLPNKIIVGRINPGIKKNIKFQSYNIPNGSQ